MSSSSEELTLSSGDFEYHPREVHLSILEDVFFVISNSCIHHFWWCVFLEDVVKGGWVDIVASFSEFWLGNILEMRNRFQATILVSFGAGGKRSHPLWLSHFLGQRGGYLLCTHGRLSFSDWNLFSSGELRKTLVEDIVTFTKPWKRIWLEFPQAMSFSNLGGCMTSWRSILGGWN